MTVPFANIPQQVRVPLFYAEMDNSRANGAVSGVRRALAIGQKLVGGTAAVNVPVIVSTVAQAIAFFGRGSQLARMVKAYRDNDNFGELWCIPVAEGTSSVAATGTVTAVGTATSTGVIALYIAGQRIQVPVLLGDTAAVVAASIVTAITANTDLPVTAAAAAGVVTLTAKWKGLTGNDITMVDSFAGSAGSEALPGGITLSYSGATLASGAVNPALAPVISAMGDEEYDFIFHPFTDSTSLDTIGAELNDTTGRWSWSRQLYGHVYTALRGSLGALVTAGGLRNDQHHTIAAIDVDCPNPSWEYAAAYAARNAVFLNADPARTVQTGVLTGLLVPRAGKRFLFAERQSLLNYGVATSYVSGGILRVERAITTYQKNAFNQADDSYLDSETLQLSAYVLRRLRSIITSKYPRHKLANDGTRFAAGSAIITPAVARGEIVADYAKMEFQGYVENSAMFAANLIVERNATDPNRLDVLFTPDYINNLRVFAVLNQFRLQY
ncbi:phage tail protein [Rhodoferax koreense]|uniref:Phage tail protein n=1 Tax=Rhodoferax koreensis TaxID=1842727 RepID=A0A1P8JYZ9_9BURK|nr:phage tail sheath subtilisin-like domain-containing protein [Rhodoferax koreense]APW38965.1 phage tail protein [Rhodoferax koreense]